MNDLLDCQHDCPLECVDTCALQGDLHTEPIVLEEALQRFDREAIRGVCNTGRYRMPYYTWGSGPPLVFVHGVSDVGRSFIQPISRLSAHFRCIAYDQPTGFGDRALVHHYRHDHLIADLFALLDYLGLRQAYLFASSFGSTVALPALHRQPTRFPRAVLQGGLAYRPLKPLEKTLVHVLRHFRASVSYLPLREKILRKRQYGPFANRSESVWRYLIECSGRPSIQSFARQLLMLDGLDLRPILPAIRQPVLMICGDCDPVVGRAEEETLHRGLPNVGRIVIENCGHLPSYTHPEIIAEVTRQFLTPPS